MIMIIYYPVIDFYTSDSNDEITPESLDNTDSIISF